jgi:hypothetical protein
MMALKLASRQRIREPGTCRIGGLHFRRARFPIRFVNAQPRPVDPPGSTLALRYGLGVGLYALLVWALWIAAHSYRVPQSLHGHFVGPFVGVALMLGVLWAFGWGAGEPLAACLAEASPNEVSHRSSQALAAASIARALTPGVFAAGVYLLLAIPLDEFSPGSLLLFFAFPSLLAALLEYLPPGAKLGWQDVIVLGALGCAVEYGWLQRSVPQPGLGNLTKFLLADVALYLYIVQRRLPGMGFDLRLHLRDLVRHGSGGIHLRRVAGGAVLSLPAAEPVGDTLAAAAGARGVSGHLRIVPLHTWCRLQLALRNSRCGRGLVLR